MIFIELTPKVSETTLEIIIFETVREFWMRFFSLDLKLMSLNLYRIKSRIWRIDKGGIKLLGTKPCLCKSQSQIESFLSVFLPRIPLTYFGLATTTSQYSSKILKTGCQYLPVDSIQT